MRPSLVVVQPPRFDLSPRVGQILEPVRVQALIPKASVETLDVTVLYGFAGLDVDQRHSALLGPRNEATAREFRPVVQPESLRLPALRYDPVQYPRHSQAGKRRVDLDCRRLLCEIIQ